MSSESSSVEMAAVKEEANEVKADQQQSAAAAAAATKMKNRRMVRLDDRYVRRRLQRLPPIKPPTVSESLLQAFPNLRHVVLRHADAHVKALIEIEADISRQYCEKGFAELDEALLSPPDS